MRIRALTLALALTAAACVKIESRPGLDVARNDRSAHATPTPTPSSADACDAAPTFADGKAPTATRHVAVTGNDATGSGSPTAPYRTLARAMQGIGPGVSVVLHAGTYAANGFYSDVRGTAEAPIWIGGAPGEPKPIIESGGEGLHFTRPRYLVLHDLEIRNIDDNGLNIDDGGGYSDPDAARYVILRGLSVHDAAIAQHGISNCIKISGLNDFVILDSDIARCGLSRDSGAVGIDGVGCHRGVIARSTFSETGFGGIQFKGGSEDIEIRANRFTNSGWRGVNMGGSTGDAYFRPPLSTTAPNFEAANIRVDANLFVGGEAAAAFVGCVDCAFRHNTVVTQEVWQLRVLQEHVSNATYTFARTAGGVISGNIFYLKRANQSYADINVGSNTDTASYSIDHNLWYAWDQPTASAPKLPGYAGAQSAQSIGLDPLFTAISDYHLQEASPAAGIGRLPPPVSADLDGRCYAIPPSAGAYEIP